MVARAMRQGSRGLERLRLGLVGRPSARGRGVGRLQNRRLRSARACDSVLAARQTEGREVPKDTVPCISSNPDMPWTAPAMMLQELEEDAWPKIENDSYTVLHGHQATNSLKGH